MESVSGPPSMFEWGEQLPRLVGQHVSLRSLVRSDAPNVFAIFGDPEVVRYWSAPPLPDLAAAENLVREIQGHFATRRLFQWGVCRRDTDQVIGTCTLFQLDRDHRRAELGFALRRSEWGRGFASDAIATVLAFAFGDLNLHRIEADVDPANERSLRALERQGFVREGYLRERWHHLGQKHDAVLLGLLRREWTRPELR